MRFKRRQGNSGFWGNIGFRVSRQAMPDTDGVTDPHKAKQRSDQRQLQLVRRKTNQEFKSKNAVGCIFIQRISSRVRVQESSGLYRAWRSYQTVIPPVRWAIEDYLNSVIRSH